jgi:methionyl-tRNA formyltransferase
MPAQQANNGDSLNVLLVGEESAGAQTLKLLAQSQHRVVGVLAAPPQQAQGSATVWRLAEQMGHRIWPAESVKEAAFAEVLRAERVDLLVNVHSLYIISRAVAEAPRYGSFNLHPGPLPRYAGLNAVSWAIYRGETSHGVTLHQMEPGIDTGPIVFQTLFPITDDDTALTVYTKCIRAGVALIQRLLETVSQNPAALPLTAQDLTQREYFGKQVPEDCCVNWARPARAIYNLVRACDYFPFRSPWGSPRATLNGHQFELTKTRLTGQACAVPPGTVRKVDSGSVAVACADEWILCDRVLLDSRAVNAAEALKSSLRD